MCGAAMRCMVLWVLCRRGVGLGLGWWIRIGLGRLWASIGDGFCRLSLLPRETVGRASVGLVVSSLMGGLEGDIDEYRGNKHWLC